MNVFLLDGPTKWATLVLYRDRNTIRRETALLDLHYATGHAAPHKMLWIIENTPHLRKQFPNVTSVHKCTIFCRICAEVNLDWKRNKKFQPSLKYETGRMWYMDVKMYHLESSDGYTCYLIGVEATTLYTVRFFMKDRTEVYDKLEEFHHFISTSKLWHHHLGKNTTRIVVQFDNAPEFASERMHNLFKTWNWTPQYTAEYVHENNTWIEGTIRRVERIYVLYGHFLVVHRG